MTILVDASAIVAIVHGEPEADDFADLIEAHVDRCYCAVGAWEAAQAIARLKEVSLQQAAAAAVTTAAAKAAAAGTATAAASTAAAAAVTSTAAAEAAAT